MPCFVQMRFSIFDLGMRLDVAFGHLRTVTKARRKRRLQIKFYFDMSSNEFIREHK